MILLTQDNALNPESAVSTTRDLIDDSLYTIETAAPSSLLKGDCVVVSFPIPPHPYRVDVGYVVSVSNTTVVVRVDTKTMDRPPNGGIATVFGFRGGEDLGPYTFTTKAKYAMATRALVKYSSREDYTINLISKKINTDAFYGKYLNLGQDQMYVVDCQQELAWKVAIEDFAITSINGAHRGSIPLTVATNRFNY